jgi:hypothetical protein
MKKNTIKLAFLALFSLFSIKNTFAQDDAPIKVALSDEYSNDNSKTIVEKILRDQNGNIILVKSSAKFFGGNKTFIESYSPDMQLQYSHELLVENINGKELNYIGAYSIGNQPFVLTSFYNKAKDFNYLLVSKIDEKGVLSKPQKISEYGTRSEREGSFELVFSRDSTKMLVINKLPTKKNQSEQFSFVVVDDTFKEIWKAKAALPYENRDVLLSDFAVDNQANVFVLATIDGGGRDRDEDLLQEIFEYQQGAASSKRYKINLKDKIINKLRIMPDNKGDIVCIGQYSSLAEKSNFFRRYRSTTMGTIFFKIDGVKNEIVNKSINPFDDKVFEYFEVKKSRVQKGYGVEYLSLWNSWIAEDNSIFLDFEMEYSVVTTDNAGGRPYGAYGNSGRTRTTYYSLSTLLVRLSPDGKVIFETVVPKGMTSINDKTGLYHTVMQKGNSTIYVYNDSNRNFNKTIETIGDVRSAFSPEGTSWVFGDRRPTVTCCIIDENGKRKFAQLFNFQKDDVFLNTENSLRYDGKTFVVLASYLRNYKLVKMAF